MMWPWLRSGNLKRKTQSLSIATQNDIRTNHIKAQADNTLKNSKCRLCGNKVKTCNVLLLSLISSVSWDKNQLILVS